jgi:hypothetical protein
VTSAELHQAIRKLIENPALIETINTLSAVLDEESVGGQVAAIADTCVSPHELETLLSQIEALAATLRKRPAGRH